MVETSSVLPPAQRQLVTFVLMGATIMVVLDTTIANVALPHMRAALGANSETVAWVLTSYIVASAMAIPLTGWLAGKLGRRLLFTIAVGGFTVSSALCGVATSLPMMVASRFLQGVFGAFLAPMSQALMYDINPPEKHAQAMTIWGMAIMIAPILGPVIGGYLTDQFDWRWVFFINVPIGIATTIFAWILLPRNPTRLARFDGFGFVLLATALASLQLMLDRGTQNDWFESPEILIEGGVAIATAWMLGVHLARHKDAIIPRRLLQDANFTTAMVFITLIGGVLLAGAALVAPMLQQLLAYPVFLAGLVTVPRGVGTLIGFVVAGRLVTRTDPRYLIATGMALLALSLWMMTGFSLQMDQELVLTSGMVQGLGLGLTMMPMNLLAFTTLPIELRTEGAALYSLMRNIGGSVVISITSALLATNLQTSHADLGAHVTDSVLPAVTPSLVAGLGMPGGALFGMIDAEINRQALMIAYLDDYWMMFWVTIIVMPLILVLRRPKQLSTDHAVME